MSAALAVASIPTVSSRAPRPATVCSRAQGPLGTSSTEQTGLAADNPLKVLIGSCTLSRVEFRQTTSQDAAGVYAVISEAFDDGGHVAELWTDVVGRNLDRASRVACIADEVVGHVGLSHAWLDARRELLDVLILSPLSVRASHQRRGIGTQLLAEAIANGADLGCPAIFLEGDPSYYGARGFQRASALGFEPPSRRIPDLAFQVALLPGHEAWMTGRLIYRDVWWEHDGAGLRDPLLAHVEEALASSS